MVTQITPKPVAQITPKPVAQITPKPVVQITPKPVAQITPKVVAQITPKVVVTTTKPGIGLASNVIQAASPTGAGVLSATSAASPAIQTKDLRLEEPEVDPVEETYDEVEDKYIEDVEATAKNKRKVILIGIAVAVVLVSVVVLINRRKK